MSYFWPPAEVTNGNADNVCSPFNALQAYVLDFNLARKAIILSITERKPQRVDNTSFPMHLKARRKYEILFVFEREFHAPNDVGMKNAAYVASIFIALNDGEGIFTIFR